MEEFADAIIDDVERRKAMHWGWIKDGGQYIPGAQVYLNGSRWGDDIEPIPAGAARFGQAGGRRAAVEANNEDALTAWTNNK